jgi:methylated-DNA-protein-cysteine methyltransferase-like protein
MGNPFFEQVHRIVRLIPPAKVATYGQIARLLGNPRAARMVGWAMHSIPEGSDVPWHRVVNARGTISLDVRGPGGAIQRALLEAEGIAFDKHGRLDLQAHGWTGPDPIELEAIKQLLSQEGDN